MKNLKGNIYLILAIVFITSTLILSSCEEVIEVDLNSSNPVLVAEGQIVKDSAVWIKISYTSDYFNNEEVTFEDNASVILTDSDNNSETLTYNGDGFYKGHVLLGDVYENYTINISTDEWEYDGESTLMPPSEIYEIVVSESELQRPELDEIAYSLEIKFKDVSATDDYYMMKFFVNGRFDSYALVDDKIFLFGDTVIYPAMRKEFFIDDEVIVRLHTVDNDAYNYYYQLNETVSDGKGPGGSSTPYNPASNFGEGVLGYFVAWSFVSDTVVIIQ